MNKKKCKGKRRYKTEQLAKKAAKVMSINYDADIMYFKCSYCQYWHIGNRPYRHPILQILAEIRRERK